MVNVIEDKVSSVLIEGQWRAADSVESFNAVNPATGEALAEQFPVSSWKDLDAALNASAACFAELHDVPRTRFSEFLVRYAERIEADAEAICKAAEQETGLPFAPRLRDIELPRTTNQLRQAASFAGQDDWRLPVIDAEANIRSVLEPIGPVAIFGPNNFPLAFNSVCGGDFAAAIAAGNPVIAKAHPLHPCTSRLLAQCAVDALSDVGLPAAMVQMVYATSNDDGLRLVSDPRLGASAFTGSRRAGTALKTASDAVGKPIFLEMASINPVVIFPGALEERFDDIVDQLATSGLMAAGQFCTNPGLILMVQGTETERFIAAVGARYDAAGCGTLFSQGTRDALAHGVGELVAAGANPITTATPSQGSGYSHPNTLLRVDGEQFIERSQAMQSEAFGNAMLMVVAKDQAEVLRIAESLEGNLTGCIYSSTNGDDDAAYDLVAPAIRRKVGRLINDKMPTGVAVSPAMNHGGPFPASGHPHFTAVGLPGAMRRFTMLACYDGVRPNRLPKLLQDAT